MGRFACIVLAAGLLVPLTECKGNTADLGGEAKDAGPFPYSGPSCGSEDACWQCMEESCGAAVLCVVEKCADYFTTVCACAPGDLSCLGAATMTAGCASCGSSIYACSMASCQAACEHAPPTPSQCQGGEVTPLQTCYEMPPVPASLSQCGGTCTFEWHQSVGDNLHHSTCPCTDLAGCALAAASCLQ